MNIKWDSQNYKDNFSFVPQYGEDVMGLITKAPGSIAIDLGCGNGTLTRKLADKGYAVIGIDVSNDMIALAKQSYPDLAFSVADALSFEAAPKADLIFSNAVFHWIDADDQDALIANVAAQLTDGGELVCEFGGYGCGEAVHSTLKKQFAARGLTYPSVFYFPTIGEYAPILERHGLRVEYAVLFDRPTPQVSDNGVADWINMFVKRPFEGMAEAMKNEIIFRTQDELKDTLYLNGTWFIDYVRIRIRARKIPCAIS